METNIVAVERIKEYTGLTREVRILSVSQSDRQTDRQTDRQIERQTDGQKDKYTPLFTSGWPFQEH